MEQTHIIILNWNGGADTWKCVQSVYGLPDVQVILVDNASTDDSMAFTRARLDEAGAGYLQLRDTEADQLAAWNEKIALVHSARNLGFAGGINLVLRPLLQREDVAYVWLLNNDAIAAPDTLHPLINALTGDKLAAFAGSAIMDGKRHEEVQCFGVRYYKWLGVAKMLFKGRSWSSIDAGELAAGQAHFQHGASLLVRTDAIRKIGLLDERFFLYSEEHDWQERAKSIGLGNVRVPQSRVYHLGSMSTSGSRYLFYYYYSKSSVLFSRKHHHGLTPAIATVMLLLITMIRTRLLPKSMRWAIKGITEAWRTTL